MTEDAQVVVVGAGPVGLTAAVGLASAGIEVVILEREPQLLGIPRASTFHPPTLEMLDDLGLAEPLMAEGYRVDRIQFRERRGGIVAEFDYGLLAGETRFPFRLQCPQGRLAEIAMDHFERVDSGAVWFDAEVIDVDLGEGGAVVRLRDGRRLRAKRLVAADGAGSRVRESLGVRFEGMTYYSRNLQLITTFEFDTVFPDLALVNYLFDPEEWGVIMRTPPGVWRVLFPVDPGEEDAQALDGDRIRSRLRTLIGDTEAEPEVEYKAIYTVHQRVAERFRVGPAVLIGDAAHVNSPIGGMGMNSGIHDAYTIVGLLRDVREGSALEGALDAWAVDRRKVALDFVREVTDGNTRMLREADDQRRNERNDRLRRMAADPELARAYLRTASMLASRQRVAP